MIIDPTFCGSIISTGRLLAIEDFSYNSNSDVHIDLVYVEWQGWKFKLVLVYLDTRGERNLKIKSKLEDIDGAVAKDNDLILHGDFNAHVGIIG